MKTSILWVIGLLFSTSLVVTSCEETEGVADPYTDWQERNEAYIDSIAKVAYANKGEDVGQWKIIHSYKFKPQEGSLEVDVRDYVYCKILEKGEGAVSPLFTDTVSVNYRGQLIPLYNGEIVTFDQSFRGEMNDDVAVPLDLQVSGVITGWTTALQQMKEGDRWMVYIPQGLGYGVSSTGSIPAYSTLVFDMKLMKIKPLR